MAIKPVRYSASNFARDDDGGTSILDTLDFRGQIWSTNGYPNE
jgi:hypothetical protein